VVDLCLRSGVSSRTMPGVFELLDGHVSVNRLRRVEIADLLRRSQVTGNLDAAVYVSDQTVLVSGAGGSIGSELCRQLAFARPGHLVLLGHGENSIFETQVRLREQFPAARLTAVIADVRDEQRLGHIFQRFRPSVVFHAAAHKHVPLMEENPEEAISNNVLGTLNVVNAAVNYGVQRLVLISTDKAVAPASVMGASKRLAELVVRDAARRCGRAFVVVRFGNVLGSRGSVVPLFKRQIEGGGPVTVTHPDMKRFFMTIPEAVHLVLEAGGMGRGGELYVLNMGQPVRIVDLAQDLIRLSGLETGDVRIDFTGMRSGEKLEESLWESDADVEPTSNRDILRIVERGDSPGQGLDEVIRALARAVATGDRESLNLALLQSVPSFAPSVRTIFGAGGDHPAA
jgi:FlaA1/EpsC-like NDP-sugar epimerase